MCIVMECIREDREASPMASDNDDRLGACPQTGAADRQDNYTSAIYMTPKTLECQLAKD